MRFLLPDFSLASLGNVLLVYALVLALHTALAWGGAAWFARKCDQRVRPWVAMEVFVLALVISFATLSWMPEGQFNYSPWQILCSGLAMVILVVVRVLRLRDIYPNFLLVWWAAVAGYSLGWSVISGLKDSTGLWAAGLMFLVMGLTAGLGAVAGLAAGLRAWLSAS